MPEAQNAALRAESVSRGPITYKRLFGVVDETFDPAIMLSNVDGQDVILNLKGVTRLSSFGVRDWVHAIEELQKRARRILFVECSVAIVSQINMVANFAGQATVVSVQAPYFCEACSWDAETTVTVSDQHQTGIPKLPQMECKRCHEQMEFDDDPAQFFAFCQSEAQRVVDSQLMGFVKDFSKAMDEAECRNELGLPDFRSGQSVDNKATSSAKALQARAKTRFGLLRKLGQWFGDHKQHSSPSKRYQMLAAGIGLLLGAGLLVSFIYWQHIRSF